MLRDERGFTLIELLVVILIIGILAAIALPTFLGQKDKAKDSSVKSDVRNAVSQMEVCYTPVQSYNTCPDADTRIPDGVTLTMLDGGIRYRVSKTSATGTNYALELISTGVVRRDCDHPGTGGCRTGGAGPGGGTW